MTQPDTFDIHDLSEHSAIRVRTIRYYVAQGLLPPPEGRGPSALYHLSHLNRLLLIRRLQEAHLPLAAIRSHLEELDDEAVQTALAQEIELAAAPDQVLREEAPETMRCRETAPPMDPEAIPLRAESAKDYAQRLLGGEQSPAAAVVQRALSRPRSETRSGKPTRSTWERLSLSEDIELHIRRPLTRSEQRRLDQLLDHAADIFNP